MHTDMAAPMLSSTATLHSSESSLRSLVDRFRRDQRPATEVEISNAVGLCEDVERQAQRESSSSRRRMMTLASQARHVFDIPATHQGSVSADNPEMSGMSLSGNDEAEGKELVLRVGKRPASASPLSNPSKRSQRERDQPAPVPAARIKDTRDIQVDLGPTIDHNDDVTNSTNAAFDHTQSLENPSATNHLFNSAPIYNQNINNGAGQQNIKVFGNFEAPL